jgi:hypothetical protein
MALGKDTYRRQTKALMVKNFHVQRRSKGTNICNVVAGALLVFMVWLMQWLVDYIVAQSDADSGLLSGSLEAGPVLQSSFSC